MITRWKNTKLKPILKYFNERCKLIVQLEAYFSIDEQIIGYKDTTAPTSFRQYMLKKATKSGFKVWTRCRVLGFVYEMILYHGSSKRSSRTTTATASLKDANLFDTERETLRKEYDSSGMVVLDLVKDVPIGSSIYFDNYFASTKIIRTWLQSDLSTNDKM